MTKGPIWVVQKYKPTLPDAADVSYVCDTTGMTTVSRPGLDTIATNFEPLMRLAGRHDSVPAAGTAGQVR